MSGLTLIYSTSPDSRKMAQMAGRMAHRGKYLSRTFPAGDKTFLHAVLEKEDDAGQIGSMPVVNEQKTAAIAFAGRLYNHRELAMMMGLVPAAGLMTDAQLVLQLFDERGPECIRLLDGSFAFAIADRDRGLFVARDPLGLTPLYISEQNGEVVLASEMKALADLVDSFDEFPAGSTYLTGRGIQQAFEIPLGGELILSPDEAIEAILQTLKEAVEKRIVADQPLGVFLSGGLDSSIIAAFTARARPGVDTFAVGMEIGRAHV